MLNPCESPYTISTTTVPTDKILESGETGSVTILPMTSALPICGNIDYTVTYASGTLLDSSIFTFIQTPTMAIQIAIVT